MKTTIVALLELTVDVGVVSGLGCSNLSESDAVLASPHHALGTGEDILASLDAMGSTFYARHIKLGVWDKRLDVVNVDCGDREVAALVAGNFTAFTAVKVTFAILPFEKFPGSRDLDALGNGLVRLEFHNQ